MDLLRRDVSGELAAPFGHAAVMRSLRRTVRTVTTAIPNGTTGSRRRGLQ
jgi:hypothetical protein